MEVHRTEIVSYKPSGAELANLVDCISLAAWAGFAADVSRAIPQNSFIADVARPMSPLQSFLGVRGASPKKKTLRLQPPTSCYFRVGVCEV